MHWPGMKLAETLVGIPTLVTCNFKLGFLQQCLEYKANGSTIQCLRVGGCQGALGAPRRLMRILLKENDNEN